MIVGVGFVIAGCDPSEVFQSVEEPLDYVSEFVSCAIIAPLMDSTAASRDYGPSALPTNLVAQPMTVVSLVSNYELWAQSSQQRLGLAHIVPISAR